MIITGLPQKPSIAPQLIAEGLLGDIDWVDGERGFCVCPGASMHQAKSARKDCKVYLDAPPSIFCFHSSCEGAVKDANYKLRRACWEQAHADEPFSAVLSDDEKVALKLKSEERKSEEALRKKTMEGREALFTKFAWDPGDMFEESPMGLKGDPDLDWRLWLSLFKPDDILWNGAVTDSGRPEMAKNFRTAEQWLKDGPSGNFTCPSTFQAGTFSRSNEAVASRPYLVVESDTLSQAEMCAVTKWMATFLPLQAVLTTGGKSIHSWFQFPSPDQFKKLQIILPELGCDRALFKASQPVRAPGVLRGDRWQALLWFKRGA